jgi:hypothetical protein
MPRETLRQTQGQTQTQRDTDTLLYPAPLKEEKEEEELLGWEGAGWGRWGGMEAMEMKGGGGGPRRVVGEREGEMQRGREGEMERDFRGLSRCSTLC